MPDAADLSSDTDKGETNSIKPLITSTDEPSSNGESASQRLRLLCLALHVALVIIHGLLFVVWKFSWEHALNVKDETSAAIRLPTVLTVVSQTAGTVGRFAFAS